MPVEIEEFNKELVDVRMIGVLELVSLILRVFVVDLIVTVEALARVSIIVNVAGLELVEGAIELGAFTVVGLDVEAYAFADLLLVNDVVLVEFGEVEVD